MSTPLLEVKNLSKVFDRDLLQKKQKILDQLSFSIKEGSCTALMGHNGAGKTTTIRSIFGLIRPDQGQILYRGQPMTQEEKRKIGYMPETNKLPAQLSCEEVLRHQLRVYRPASIPRASYQQCIEQSLQEVGLFEHRHKKVGKLSKGMGRRLSWAQATIHQPELIILDEPMSGLDPMGHKLMAGFIQELRQKKVTLLLCTHELWSIRELCDDVHILRKGKLVYSSHSPSPEAPPSKGQAHFLSLSGLKTPEWNSFQAQKALPDPLDKIEQSFRLDLWFQNYPEALKWLQAAIEAGLLVLAFHKSSGFDEQHLLRYFIEETHS